ARPLELYDGMVMTAERLVGELTAAGYHPVRTLNRAGSFERNRHRFRIATRAFRFWDGDEPSRSLDIVIRQGRISAITEGQDAVPIARLDPALIGRVYPGHREDRILVQADDLPQYLRDGLLAVEDRGFHRHFGISVRGILRAIVSNIRAGEAVQGGSTITQQLAKNLFLSPARTLSRKLNEAAIALILETRYSKAEIFEMYLNEVYLGQEGGRAIHGFGLAAWFYFGRRVDELSVAESALLIGLVKGASAYNPRRQPKRALSRRNLVIEVMARDEVISAAEANGAKESPLGVSKKKPKGASPHPGFIDLVRRQLAEDYRESDLRTEGLRIFTTLDPHEQRQAERGLEARIGRLERSKKLSELNGAVVIVAPKTGEVTALVGGREVGAVGFNRALDAVRPIGSLVKPAVYLAALESKRYTLVSPLDDSPVEIKSGQGEPWRPANYDGKFEGQVPLRRALADSKNLATVHLGMAVGLENVKATLQKLGVERAIDTYPSTLLGTLALSPLDVAQMYQTVANQGFRIPLRAIREVTDKTGEPLERYGLALSQTIAPEPIFLLVNGMQSVVAEGTARALPALLEKPVELAGKTGTTDGLRDSWFAGFGRDRLGVVWLGRDDNEPAGLSGSSGALRVWADVMGPLNVASLRPSTPPGVHWLATDPERFAVLDPTCGDTHTIDLPFIDGSAPPYEPCDSLLPRVRQFRFEPAPQDEDSPG
ncbi:MAG: penicillin-binding protein 1B, partial [Pseudomonadota bacterium]